MRLYNVHTDARQHRWTTCYLAFVTTLLLVIAAHDHGWLG